MAARPTSSSSVSCCCACGLAWVVVTAAATAWRRPCFRLVLLYAYIRITLSGNAKLYFIDIYTQIVFKIPDRIMGTSACLCMLVHLTRHSFKWRPSHSRFGEARVSLLLCPVWMAFPASRSPRVMAIARRAVAPASATAFLWCCFSPPLSEVFHERKNNEKLYVVLSEKWSTLEFNITSPIGWIQARVALPLRQTTSGVQGTPCFSSHVK